MPRRLSGAVANLAKNQRNRNPLDTAFNGPEDFMKARGTKQYKKRTGLARESILRYVLPAINSEFDFPFCHPSSDDKFPLPRVVAVEPDQQGRLRIRFDGERGTFRLTLPHNFDPLSSWGKEITSKDVLLIEVLVLREPDARPELADLPGPLWDSRWLKSEEYIEALKLLHEIEAGTVYKNITVHTNPLYPQWTIIEIPHPEKLDRAIVVNLPVVDGPWGKANRSAFLFLVTTSKVRRRVPLHVPVRLPEVLQ
jgi:hypothetical protein